MEEKDKIPQPKASTVRSIRAEIEEETKGMTAMEARAYYEAKSKRKVTPRKRLQ